MRTLKPVIIMNKFKFYFSVLIVALTLFSCNKDEDTITSLPLKPYTDQETVDEATINTYLNSYYIFSIDDDLSITFAPLTKTGKIKTLIDSPIITGTGTNFTNELIVGDELYKTDGVTKIGTVLEINSNTKITLEANAPFSTEVSVVDGKNVDALIRCKVKKTTIKDQTDYVIKSRIVELHGISYTLKYLVLREGIGTAPTNTDGVFAAYKGFYLQNSTSNGETILTDTDFEEVKYPSSFFSLLNVIRGWSEVFPQFKTGTYGKRNPDGTLTHKDFGAGVMFIPSGLAYYNNPPGSIPSYAPLVFSFKLYEIQRADTDGDGVLNYLEDIKDDKGIEIKDRYMYSFNNIINYPKYPGPDPDETKDNFWYYDDSDRDGIPNYLDIDDDGDRYSTAYEISKGTDYLNKNLYPPKS